MYLGIEKYHKQHYTDTSSKQRLYYFTDYNITIE